MERKKRKDNTSEEAKKAWKERNGFGERKINLYDKDFFAFKIACELTDKKIGAEVTAFMRDFAKKAGISDSDPRVKKLLDEKEEKKLLKKNKNRRKYF